MKMCIRSKMVEQKDADEKMMFGAVDRSTVVEVNEKFLPQQQITTVPRRDSPYVSSSIVIQLLFVHSTVSKE